MINQDPEWLMYTQRPRICIECGSCRASECCIHKTKFLIFVGMFIANVLRRKDYRIYRIASGSMFPTLKVNDFVLVEPLNRDKLEYESLRNKSVVFHNPYFTAGKSHELLSKRVIGVMGDTIRLKEGVLWINDIVEPNLKLPYILNVNFREWKVPKDSVFVVGDNRNCSYDSIDYGPIPTQYLIGVVRYRYWPPWRLRFNF